MSVLLGTDFATWVMGHKNRAHQVFFDHYSSDAEFKDLVNLQFGDHVADETERAKALVCNSLEQLDDT